MDMTLDFSILLRFVDALAIGLWTTIKLTLLCIVLGTALGFVIGLLRSSGSAILRALLGFYVELFRGTPVLIQLFWIFFCLPLILGTELPNFVSAVKRLTGRSI